MTTLVTLGRSDGRAVRQELLMQVPNAGYPSRAAGLLFQVAGEMVRHGTGLPDGQLIGPRGPLFPGSRTTAWSRPHRTTCRRPSQSGAAIPRR